MGGTRLWGSQATSHVHSTETHTPLHRQPHVHVCSWAWALSTGSREPLHLANWVHVHNHRCPRRASLGSGSSRLWKPGQGCMHTHVCVCVCGVVSLCLRGPTTASKSWECRAHVSSNTAPCHRKQGQSSERAHDLPSVTQQGGASLGGK